MLENGRMKSETYDKNNNPVILYESLEWPFKTKKAEKEARNEIYNLNGQGWWWFEGWNARTYRKLPWISRFHPEYKEILRLRRNRK